MKDLYKNWGNLKSDKIRACLLTALLVWRGGRRAQAQWQNITCTHRDSYSKLGSKLIYACAYY